MKISSQAQFVAIHVTDANDVQIWDLANRQMPRVVTNNQDKPKAFAWSSNDRYCAILWQSGTLTVWDVSDDSQVYAGGDSGRPVTTMAWVPQRDQLSLPSGGSIDLLNIPTGSVAKSIQLPLSTPVDDLAWSHTGKMFSLISEKHVSFMDLASSRLQSLHVPNITAQNWVGNHLILSDSQGSLFCVDPSSGKIVHRWISEWCGPIRQVRVSSADDRVALLSANGTLSLWDMYTWEPVNFIGAQGINPEGPQDAVLLWSPTGDELMSSDPSGTRLVFRDSHSLQTLRTLSVPGTRITCAEGSEKGLLVVGTEKGDLYICQWSQTEFLSHLQGHQGPVTAVVWMAPTQTIVSAGHDQTIRFWDGLTGQCTKTLTDQKAPVSDLVLSPNQKTLASIDLNREVLLWDASSGSQIQRLSDDTIDHPRWEGELTAAAWSPDGTMLAAAANGGGIQIWRPQAKNVWRRRHTRGQCVHSIAWSPDNRYLLAGAADGTTRVWDVLNDLRRHVLLLPLSGTAGPGIAVADEGDYRGPPGIHRHLRYVVDSERGHQTLRAGEFHNNWGWVNEPWQVGLFQPGKEEIRRLYVKADAQGPFDGLTWNTAFNDLQDALSRAAQETEIWVTRGIYRPDRGTGVREASFVLRDGMRVYGGFIGNETAVHRRDPEQNVTILSGDLSGNDRGLENNDENSFHVVVVERPPKRVEPQGVLLDGFTIRGGNASESREDTQEQERKRDGGGLLIEGDRVTVQNCVFEHNAAFHSGGGLVLGGNENLVQDCEFSNNVSRTLGGGLSLRANAGRVSHCVFESNRAKQGGGLDFNARDSLVVDCEFVMNQAENGGAVFGGQDETVSLLFCTFYRNRAANEGGAWFQQYTRAMNAQNCLFVNNSADRSGGALVSHGYRGRARLEGCGFIGNSAVRSGGAITYTDSKINAVNCSFMYNQINGDPRDRGFVGGIYHNVRDPNNDTALILSNCILWGNADHRHGGEKAQLEALNTQINNCCIQGWTGRLGDSDNQADDPLFINLPGSDGILGTPDDDLRLSPESPCIDQGDTRFMGPDEVDMDQDEDVNEAIPLDLHQQPRVLGSNVDIGASEAR
jgi:WD40 repeat protein